MPLISHVTLGKPHPQVSLVYDLAMWGLSFVISDILNVD